MSTILAFDLETTSSDPDTARIVQIGYIIAEQMTPVPGIKNPTPSFDVKKEVMFLVNPGVPIPAEATEVHGITDQDVENEPSFDRYAEDLQALIEGKTLLAYNAGYDLQILDRHLIAAGQVGVTAGPDQVIDPLEIEKRVNPRTLEAVYERYTGKTLDDAHDALADASAALQVYVHQHDQHQPEHTTLADIVQDRDGYEPADLFGKLALDDDGDLIFLFGKHNGEKVKHNADYVRWLLKKGFPGQVKDLVRAELS